jgi:gliding motility-associated-like protein
LIANPSANFGSIDTLSCPNKPIAFLDSTSGDNLTYAWRFGDGNGSTLVSPVHQYTADGHYTVQLIVVDRYGCRDTVVRPQYIRIVSPRPAFSMSDSIGTCPPLFVLFTNQSQNYTQLNWDFGDGASSNEINPSHFYITPGTFQVVLTITSPGGCVDSIRKTIVVRGPSGQFTYTPVSGCKPLTVQFNATAINTANYVWDFNNGQTASSGSNALTYTYTLPGKYLPRVILEDGQGCSIPILGTDSVNVIGVEASATASTQLLCDSGRVDFSLNTISNDAIVSYQWTFGDGGTSSQVNPSHIYTTSGNYAPQCIITTQQGCRDTAILNLPINIIQSPIVGINGIPGSCIPATAQFNGTIIRNDTSALNWQWNFGNGQTATGINPPSVNYPNAGTYQVQCIATNSSGCTDTTYYTFNAWALPVIDAGINRQICRNSPEQLTATGGTSYVWWPGNGLSCTQCASPMAAPDTSRRYWVTGTDQNGCVNRDSVDITVIQPFVMNQSPDREFCAGRFVSLNATGAATYSWSPAAGLSATSGASVIARPTVTTTYRVVGYDAYNCFTDTGYIQVRVNPIPTVNAGPDQTITGGNTAQLQATASSDVVSYAWTPGNTLSCFNCPNPVAQPNQTTRYSVEVTNRGGCKNTDEVTVFVVCDKGNLFIPNTFSPNGDGMNDRLYPRGKGVYIVKSFKIFNRWGELVYEAINFSPNDPLKGWDGTYKGKPLNPDVFVYLIEVICDNERPIGFKGNISLIK